MIDWSSADVNCDFELARPARRASDAGPIYAAVTTKRKGVGPVRDRPPLRLINSPDQGTTSSVSCWINAPGPPKPADRLMAGALGGTQ